MKIIIAGGTGLIGSAIAQSLIREKHSVVLLSRSGRTVHKGTLLLRWDAQNLGDWMACLEGADAVINLCGESLGEGRWTTSRKKEILESRVRSSRILAEAIGKTGRKPSVLVNASAVGYYGDVEELPMYESSPPGTDFMAAVCREWESAASGASAHGIRVVMMRTGFVIAARSEAFRRMILPFKLFAGGQYGSGRQWFPWVHLADVVGGYVTAVENKSLSGPVNLTSPNPVQVRELAKSLGRALHRPSSLPAPAFALKLALGEMSDLLLNGQRVIPQKLTESGYVFKFPRLPEALTDAVSAA